MEITCQFRHMNKSEEVEAFAEDRFQKLTKFETKPLHVRLTFTAERHFLRTDVYVSGCDVSFRASAESENLFDAIDQVAGKVGKQMAKKKAKIQNHRNVAKSKEGRLKRLTPELEVIPMDPATMRKAG